MDPNQPPCGGNGDHGTGSPGSRRWIVAQEGSRESYAIPLGFHCSEQLRWFFTDVWCRHGRGLLQRGPAGARAFAGCYKPQIPSRQVVSFNARAVLAKAKYHFRRSHLAPEEHAAVFIHYGRWFAEKVRRHMAETDLDPKRDFFFGFNTNCLETIEHLRQRGVFCVVDQVDPARIEEDLIMEESKRWPGWEKNPGRMPRAYWDRLGAEWDLASLVLVNSDWSADALVRQGVGRKKIVVVPLSIELPHDRPSEPVSVTGNLKVLWLGKVILRKGIQYLVEAARLLEKGSIEFLLAGPLGISDEAVRSFPGNIRILGRITRDQLGEVYRQAHVFVLPTISDGFAITQLEAMAHGLPVIATPNCGRVVTDGLDGFIVPPRDGRALAEALVRLDADRDRLREMSKSALVTVGKYDVPSNARLINRLVAQHEIRTAGSLQQ